MLSGKANTQNESSKVKAMFWNGSDGKWWNQVRGNNQDDREYDLFNDLEAEYINGCRIKGKYMKFSE